MFDVQTLRVSVQQRLTAAAEDIFELIERTIAEYEETLCRQQKLLDAVFKPQVRLQRADVQLLSVSKEVPPEQQDWSPSLDQDDPPELPHIKEEQEELWTNQEEEQLQGLEEADITKFTFSPVPVKSEEDQEKPQSSQLHHIEEMKKKSDGEDCGGPEPDRSPDDGHWGMSSESQSGLNFLINVGEKSFICSMCGKRFSDNSNLKRHIKIHTGEKPFSCTVCSRRFIQKVHLKRHMMRHIVRELYSCSLCPKRFVLQSQLRNHQCCGRQSSQLHHRQDHRDADGGEPDMSFNPDSHLQPVTDDSRDWETTSQPQSGLNNGEPECNSGTTTVSSSESATSYGDKDHLQEHSGDPTGEKPFSCSFCGKSYLRRNFLVDHMRLHTEGKGFSCSVCKKTFKCRSNFLTHMRIHTGEKPFCCSVCGKTFAQSSALNLHLRVHTGEKPFSCSVCNAAFSFGSNLTQHMRTHTGEKPFSCSMCSKGFSRKEQLKQHQAIHTGEKPFSCSVCTKAFAVSSSLTSHMRVHTGEKPFTCSVCKASFGFRSNLSTHMRTHAGRNASAALCDKTSAELQ